MLEYIQSERIRLLVKNSKRDKAEIVEFFVKELEKRQFKISDGVRFSGSDIVGFLAEELKISEAIVVESLVMELGVSRSKLRQGIKLGPYIEVYLNWRVASLDRGYAQKGL